MIDTDRAGWITPNRLDRLGRSLRMVGGTGPPGLRIEAAEQLVWKSVGGPRAEIGHLLELGVEIGLITTQQGHYRTTKLGRRVATQDHRAGGTLLVGALISSGIFHEQARQLLESSELDEVTGDALCPRVRVLEVAPQLSGALRRFPDVDFGTNLRVPHHLVKELDEAWISASTILQRDRRKALGDRGEEFSYRWLREQARDRTQVHWVAQEDETLGYDIEDHNHEPVQRVEVKCSSGSEVRFFLSSNEWDQAQIDPDHYLIHYWGGVNIEASPLEEFNRLVADGFPIVYVNPRRLVTEGGLISEPATYLVTESLQLATEEGA